MLLLLIRKVEEGIQVVGARSFAHDVNYHQDNHREVLQDAYDFVLDNIESNTITYPDNPSTTIPEIRHFNLTPIDPSEQAKGVAMSYFNQVVLEKSITSDFYLTFLDYTQLNNVLASKGYFITDENREEMYLEILNTGDLNLIQTLEDFLVTLDEISEHRGAIETFRADKRAVRGASTAAEVNTYFKGKTGKDIADAVRS